MWEPFANATIKLGGNYFIGTPVMLGYEGQSFISVVINPSNGHLGIDCLVCGADGEKIATIKQNRIYTNKAHEGDYQVDGDANSCVLIHKETKTELVTIAHRDAAEPFHFAMTVDLYLPNGVRFAASEDKIQLANAHMSGNTFIGQSIAINVKSDGGIEIG